MPAASVHFTAPRRKDDAGATDIERVDVSEPASISTGIAQRYATAIFELSRESGAVDRLEKDVDALEAALSESSDLRALIVSPIYRRSDQARAMAALAPKMNLSAPVAGALGLMSNKRRLFVLPQLLKALRARIAQERGEMSADVVSAKKLTKAQSEKLSKALSARTGKDVKLNQTVDDTLIGGLVVKVGSKMIDTSIRSRLAALKNAMKEVG